MMGVPMTMVRVDELDSLIGHLALLQGFVGELASAVGITPSGGRAGSIEGAEVLKILARHGLVERLEEDVYRGLDALQYCLQAASERSLAVVQ